MDVVSYNSDIVSNVYSIFKRREESALLPIDMNHHFDAMHHRFSFERGSTRPFFISNSDNESVSGDESIKSTKRSKKISAKKTTKTEHQNYFYDLPIRNSSYVHVPSFCRKRLPENNWYNTRPILIRVFSGGKDNEQVAPFMDGCKRFIQQESLSHTYFIIEMMNNNGIRGKARSDRDTWSTPAGLVDWLLGSDIHVIPTQGIFMGLIGINNEGISWSIADINKQLKRFVPLFP